MFFASQERYCQIHDKKNNEYSNYRADNLNCSLNQEIKAIFKQSTHQEK